LTRRLPWKVSLTVFREISPVLLFEKEPS
jgi:hypothetical protein